MFYLVSYDIPDDRRRTRIAKILKDFGNRVQKSVFECLLEKREFNRLVERLEKSIDEKEDSVRIYELCSECQEKVAVIGQGTVTKDDDVYII